MNKKYLSELVVAIRALGTDKELLVFLEGILTPQELTDISVRLQIVKLLKQGLPQREIADKLGVGVATVTRGSKEIQLGRFNHV